VPARARAALVAMGAAVAVGVVAGCGPSFQAVYEGDVRFEHCYALDQTAAGPDAKKECWRGWLHGYTWGQSRDRIEFAAARFSELSLDRTLPSEDTGQRPARRVRPASPMPTSAFAPPPNVAGDGTASPAPPQLPPPPSPPVAPPPQAVVAVAAPAGTAHVQTLVPRAPGEQCTSACAERWTSCRRGCVDGSCDACDRGYRACVPGCFLEVRQAPRSLR